MIGASIETTRELWASSLREVKKRIRPLFAQERAALNAGLFVDGLLGDERRKTGWMRAEAAGDPGPWRQQAVLGRDRWDADALRDLVRDYATEHLADENAVLVIDETGFLKQGKASCGVARQYTGSAGKITNCQIGVFAAYVSRHGHAFIDRALYLPKGWTDDPARLKATYVPGDIGFSTKPQLAAEMIERALAAGVPFRWVAADSVYGVGDIERDLRQAGKGYVLGVNSNHWFASWGKPQWVVGTAEEIAKTQRRSDWRRLSAGAGTKGPRLHDWCYLELADLEGEESNHHSQVLCTRGLLIRRNIANGDLAYFTTWALGHFGRGVLRLVMAALAPPGCLCQPLFPRAADRRRRQEKSAKSAPTRPDGGRPVRCGPPRRPGPRGEHLEGGASNPADHSSPHPTATTGAARGGLPAAVLPLWGPRSNSRSRSQVRQARCINQRDVLIKGHDLGI